MKPKQLKAPFTWDERKVLLQDRVWYVPSYYSDYQSWEFPGWSHPDFFGNEQPVVVEYCCGNGAWITEKAQQHQDKNWIAVEKRFDRVRKVWSKIQNLNLSNLVIVCGEAQTVTQQYIPRESIQEVYVNFPDPWPKERHAKHRLIQPAFVKGVTRVLQKKGTLTLVTDDPGYSEQSIAVLLAEQGLVSCHPDPYYVTEWPDYGASYFDSLWREKGRTIRYHTFIKKDGE